MKAFIGGLHVLELARPLHIVARRELPVHGLGDHFLRSLHVGTDIDPFDIHVNTAIRSEFSLLIAGGP